MVGPKCSRQMTLVTSSSFGLSPLKFVLHLVALEHDSVEKEGVRVILERPNGLLIEQTLRFAFKASNNQDDSRDVASQGVEILEFVGESYLFLVTGKVTGEYQTKDPQLASYLTYVMKVAFSTFDLVNLLSKLASSGKGGR